MFFRLLSSDLFAINRLSSYTFGYLMDTPDVDGHPPDKIQRHSGRPYVTIFHPLILKDDV